MPTSHGHSGHREANGRKASRTYNSWRAMIARCRHPARRDFQYYGARGIQVCPQWLTERMGGYGGFYRFLGDMGERPEAMTLDRIDVHGHYEPGNCRWADKWDQAVNRRGSLMAGQGFMFGGGADEGWEPEDWLVPVKWPQLVVVVAESEVVRGLEPGEEMPF